MDKGDWKIKPLKNKSIMSISLKNYILNKVYEAEEMQEYSFASDTIRCWIEEYDENKAIQITEEGKKHLMAIQELMKK